MRKHNTSTPVPKCRMDLVEHEGICYKVFPKKNFEDAALDCQRRGAHLASIQNDKQNDYITAAVNKSCELKDQMWIGFERRQTDKFVWLDYYQGNYTNWGNSKPDNLNSNKECAQIFIQEGCEGSVPKGKWNNINCDLEMQYICKGPKYA
uniref:C-type lectin domain-containing protein n=1 Tax=Panagrolaimus davidi TaxID=227884 RepID=A0A914NZG7_9BILA